MSALEAPGNGKSAFERRAEEAMRRRKMPTKDDSVIQLPDLNAKESNEPEQRQPQGEKRYFNLLPGEIAGALPDGGHYTIDENADPAAPGIFTYKGKRLRPVTLEEKTDAKKSSRRLDTLEDDDADTQRRDAQEDPVGPARSSATGPKIPQGKGEPDLRDDVSKHRDDFADDHKQPRASDSRTTEPRIKQSGGNGNDGDSKGRGGGNSGGGGRGGNGANGASSGRAEDGARGRGRPVDSGAIFANTQGERSSHARDQWPIDDREYIGVKVKRIQDILANEQMQNDFGRILKAINPDKGDVLLRYKEGTATKEDMDFMTYGAHEYSKWSQKAEAINAGLTKEDVELFGKRNGDMRNFVAHIKEGRDVEYVRRLVMHLAMTDRRALQDLEYSFKNLASARETMRFKVSEEKRIALAKRIGINPKDYDALFDLNNPSLRSEAEHRIAERIHEGASGFRRAIDWAEKFSRMSRTSGFVIPGSSRDAAIRAVMEANHITPSQSYRSSPTSWARDTVGRSLDSISDILGNTVASEEARRAIIAETIHNRPVSFASEQGPRTFAQVQSLEKQERYTEAGMKKRIDAFMKTDEYAHAHTPEEQDEALAQFKKREMQEAKGGGFFAWLFAVIFGTRFNKAASEATGRPVTV